MATIPGTLRMTAAGRIADFKLPHDLVLGPVPRNPSGKILKHQLRAAVLREPQEAARAS